MNIDTKAAIYNPAGMMACVFLMNHMHITYQNKKACSHLHTAILFLMSIVYFSCEVTPVKQHQIIADSLSLAKQASLQNTAIPDTPAVDNAPAKTNDIKMIPLATGKIQPVELIAFAQTLIGTPYVYGSTDPAVGFDCSGFISYVFNHFNISVPRSSIDFTTLGKDIPIEQATSGDLILFTGTNPMETNVGHMGIVLANDATGLRFIHATSGKAMSVTISPLSDQYRKRFVRICRVF